MYKLIFFVPASHVEQVKQTLFDIGAGQYAGYDFCSWQVLGEGQFRPLSGSKPFVGEMDTLEKIPEYKVEMVCRTELIKPALQALLTAHPYQQPAYEVYKLLTLNDLDETTGTPTV